MRVFLSRLIYDFAMSRVWKAHANSEIYSIDKAVTASDGYQIPIRVYRPKDTANKKLPSIIYYHGGGFTIGSIKGYHNFCNALSEMNQCMVISIDYRLAPEHPYPTPLKDCLDASHWIFNNVDDLGTTGKVILAGDSAGGNIAAVISHKLKISHAENLKGQLLICPVTDRHVPEKGSLVSNAKVGPLTAGMFRWFTKQHTGKGVVSVDLDMFPLKQEDFTNLPPALVFTAELDVLRDDGNLYAEKLKAAGIDTLHIERANEVHNFPIGRNRTDNSDALAQIKQWTAERFAV